jgi:hypothetical protein
MRYPLRPAAAATPPVSAGAAEPISRFTVRMYSEADAEHLDNWLTVARRNLGQRPEKARVVRELLRLLDDPEVAAKVYARLRAPEAS